MPAAFLHFSRLATLWSPGETVRPCSSHLRKPMPCEAAAGNASHFAPRVVASRSAATMNHHRGGMSGRGV